MEKTLLLTLAAGGYQHLLKPLAFHFDPEKVHESVTNFGEFIGNYPAARTILTKALVVTHPSLSQDIAGIHFPNPIGLSAGFDYEAKLVDILPAIGFGFHSIG